LNVELAISNANFYGFLFQYTNWDQVKDGYLNQRAIADIVGDYFFICPSTYFAELFAARNMKVYYYFFTQVSDYFCYHVLFSSIGISHRRRLYTSSKDSGELTNCRYITILQTVVTQLIPIYEANVKSCLRFDLSRFLRGNRL